MLYNYLKVALRALAKQKVYSFINLLGLSVSLTATLLIALYIIDELSFDTFHRRANQIYRITKSIESSNESRTTTLVATQIGPGAVESLPEVENATRFMHLGRITVGHDDFRSYEPYNYAEPSFFEVFDFPLLAGEPKTALQEPNSVVLTEESAKKYFGNDEALGKMLYTNLGEVKVTGVLPDFPSNSHINVPMLFSMSSGKVVFDWWSDWASNDWSSSNLVTYLLVAEDTDPNQLTNKLTQLIESHQEDPDEATHTFALQPLQDIHFGSQDIDQEHNTHESQGHYLWIFFSVGALILVIAIINYVNLATARATQRRKEVGLRKVIGATRQGLINQFIGESIVLTLLAMLLAVTLVQFILPTFNQFTGKTLALPITSVPVAFALLATTLLVGMLAGSYPGFYLSRYRPTDIFRGSVPTSTKLSLRHGLVVLQFVISVGMIAATLIIYEQMQYIRHKDIGYQREQIVTVDINSGILRAQFESIKQSFLALPEVEAVSVSSRVPSEWKVLPTVTLDHPELTSTQFLYLGADEDFLDTYEIDLESGRNFRTASDSTKILINQAAARLLGMDNPVSTSITINSFGFGELEEPFVAEIIGVVEDFHMQSLREAVAPLIIAYRNNPLHNIDYYSLKINSADMAATIQSLSDINSEFDPENPIEYHLLEDKFWEMYQEDTRRGQLFAVAAGLAILVACLGLFALASFTTQQRSREVSIRKVMGAQALQIMVLIGKRYLLLLAVAFLIALPLVYWFMQSWLAGFAYRTSISVGELVATGGIVILLAILAVGYQTLKAAWTNPADVLRTE
jgi:putative ABC transport system permease protein